MLLAVVETTGSALRAHVVSYCIAGEAERDIAATMVATNAHPPIVDLSNFEERKQEITQQLMDAATHSGASRRAHSGNRFRHHSCACLHRRGACVLHICATMHSVM